MWRDGDIIKTIKTRHQMDAYVTNIVIDAKDHWHMRWLDDQDPIITHWPARDDNMSITEMVTDLFREPYENIDSRPTKNR